MFQVYIVGHAAPGMDLRPAYNSLSVDASAKYLKMIRRHAKIIAGQFFGHLHADTFRVIYDKGCILYFQYVNKYKFK